MAYGMGSKSYDELRRELLSTRDTNGTPTLFNDPWFPPDMRSLYKDGIPPYFSYRPEEIVWKRAHDLVNDPQFVVGDVNRHDIHQGQLGDGWFLTATVAMATSHKHEFQRVVPIDQSFETERYTGMFRFNFWWYGEWVEVIIDDYLPTVNDKLIFCSNRQRPNEFWPSLLEKAYAKLKGSYGHLDGGNILDALVDMTGGITERLNDVSSAELNGLFRGLAYSITGFKKIPTGNGTANLLRLQHPWGHGGEWKGPWSDKSPEMTGPSQKLQQKLGFKNQDDGEFWMSFEDFLTNFDELQLCHLQPDAFITELADNDVPRKQLWNETVYHSKWIRGVTAGGSGNDPYGSSVGDPLPLQTTISQARMMLDLFWRNPQFYATLESPDTTLGQENYCTLLVSLMKTAQEYESRIGFQIYKLTNPDLQPLEGSGSAWQKFGQSQFYSFNRQVTLRFKLQPGTYAIVPSTFHPHKEVSFMLRLFTVKHIKSGVLDEVVEENPTPSESSKRDQE